MPSLCLDCDAILKDDGVVSRWESKLYPTPNEIPHLRRTHPEPCDLRVKARTPLRDGLPWLVLACIPMLLVLLTMRALIRIPQVVLPMRALLRKNQAQARSVHNLSLIHI